MRFRIKSGEKMFARKVMGDDEYHSEKKVLKKVDVWFSREHGGGQAVFEDPAPLWHLPRKDEK
jgi:hypothetical protein